MKSYFKMIFAAALIGFSTSANAIDRHSLAQYAASLKGLKKEQLKAALYDIYEAENSARLWWKTERNMVWILVL